MAGWLPRSAIHLCCIIMTATQERKPGFTLAASHRYASVRESTMTLEKKEDLKARMEPLGYTSQSEPKTTPATLRKQYIHTRGNIALQLQDEVLLETENIEDRGNGDQRARRRRVKSKRARPQKRKEGKECMHAAGGVRQRPLLAWT